ncbi:MAG: hypothetical protein ACPHK3_01655 [Candidatus Poseidoniaceae archaeon]
MKGSKHDEAAAATELGYVFTFLLGVVLLSVFGVWAYSIETATRERWNSAAIQANLDDVAEAVERADDAARLDATLRYVERVDWRPSEADETTMTLVLGQDELRLDHAGGDLDATVLLSGLGPATHEGEVVLAGIESVWVIYDQGVTRIALIPPLDTLSGS